MHNQDPQLAESLILPILPQWTVTNVSTLSGGATLGYIKSDETKAYLACRGDLAAGIQLCVVASKDDAHQFVIRPIVPASTNYV